MSTGEAAEAFLVEADELLDTIEQALLDLSADLTSRDLVDAVFRGMHTLKGSGAMFGFDSLAGFTHHCESAFDKVRKGQVPVTASLVAVTLSAMDHMRSLVSAPNADLHAASAQILDQLQAALDASTSGMISAPGQAGGAGERQAVQSTWRVSFRLPADALLNGTNPLLLLDELRALGDASVTALTDQVPPLAELDPTLCYLGWEVIVSGQITREAIEDVFLFVLDDANLSLELLDSCEPNEDVSAPGVTQSPPPGKAPPPPEETAGRSGKASGETVRVPAERLDDLMDRVGELVIVQSRLAQLANGTMASAAGELALRSVSEEVERLAAELRATMMVLRMVPVASIFSRFRRLVHDLARETGKSIHFETEGESTEIDKTVSERLFDPIVHLIRNACDHGVGTAEQRQTVGKSPEGHIRLSAQQAGGEVLITIRDDGHGIDREVVRAKAQANGLVQASDSLTDQEVLQLIFQPGFSTAETVTNLSGRGVGMDVVKKTIETIGGTIEVSSELGKGTTITLRIPLTLAIIEGLLVRVGNDRCVIPLSAVEECIELSLEEDIRSRGRSLIQLRDHMVPFLRLRELFDTGTRPDTFQKIVVIATGGERVGLVVDQIIGSHQTVIKSMSSLHRSIPSFSGATILGDGGVALILDVVQLVALGQRHEEQLRAAG